MALIQAFISSAEFYRAAAILRDKLVYVLRARSSNGCHISFPLIDLTSCKRPSLALPAAALLPHLRWAYWYGLCRPTWSTVRQRSTVALRFNLVRAAAQENDDRASGHFVANRGERLPLVWL